MSGSIKHPRKNKPTFQRYAHDDHRLTNKLRRVAKNGGSKAEALVKAYKELRPKKAVQSTLK